MQPYVHNTNYLLVRLSLLLCFLLLIVSRNIGLFSDPRFWAEEATLYFSHAYSHSLSQQITFIAAGYYSLVSAVSTALAHRLVMLESAPIITTLFALSVQLLPAIVVLFGNIQSFATLRIKIIALLVLLFVIPNTEVWLNVINSQFYLAISTALILIHNSRTLAEKFAGYCVLLVSGLSGVISLFLFPLFVFRAFSSNSREKWVQSFILLLAGMVQAYLILTSDNGLREGGFDALTFVFVFIIKVCLLPVLGYDLTASIVPIFKQIILASWPIKSLAIGMITLLVWVLVNYIKPFLTTDARYLFAASLLLFFFSVYGSLGDKLQLINAASGERYFTAPNTLFYLSMLALLAHNCSHKFWRIDKQKWPMQLIIGLVLISGVLNYWSHKENVSMAGPSWKQQILQNKDGLRKIKIWPEGWFINLNKQDSQILESCQQSQFMENKLLCLIYQDKKIKIKILLIQNKKTIIHYDLLTYEILENRNTDSLPKKVIFPFVADEKNNTSKTVKLKIMQDGVFFSAQVLGSKKT